MNGTCTPSQQQPQLFHGQPLTDDRVSPGQSPTAGQCLFGIGLLTLTSLPAGAADTAARIPTKAPVMAPEPAWNWTGFYVGVNGGYG